MTTDYAGGSTRANMCSVGVSTRSKRCAINSTDVLSDRRPIGIARQKVISMSTALAHDPTTSAFSGRPIVRDRRRHLALVGGDDPPSRSPEVSHGDRWGQALDGSVPRATPDRQVEPLRLTRRGRLALTSTVAFVVAGLLMSMIGVLGPAGATTSVVVEPGMTLSQIAAEELPDLPLDRAITDIQRANRLSTTSIAAGQELLIPSER